MATNTKRGIVAAGNGNWRNVTVTRVRPQESGIDVAEGAAVAKLAANSADVMLAAGATNGWKALEDAHGKAIADEIVGAAVRWAQARGSKRVWDIDLAFAAGFEVSPDGAKAFRSAFGLKVPSTPWPNKPEQTPDPQFKGPVVDVETGKLV